MNVTTVPAGQAFSRRWRPLLQEMWKVQQRSLFLKQLYTCWLFASFLMASVNIPLVVETVLLPRSVYHFKQGTCSTYHFKHTNYVYCSPYLSTTSICAKLLGSNKRALFKYDITMACSIMPLLWGITNNEVRSFTY